MDDSIEIGHLLLGINTIRVDFLNHNGKLFLEVIAKDSFSIVADLLIDKLQMMLFR